MNYYLKRALRATFLFLFFILVNFCSAQFSLPYSQGFETGFTSATSISGVGNLSVESVSGSGTWVSQNGSLSNNRSAKTGTWFIYLGQSNTDWLFIPISVTAGNYYSISLQAKEYNNAGSENIDISIGASNTAASMTTSLVSNFDLSSSYQEVQTNFVASSTGTLYVGINGEAASGNNISIDDISIEEAPCLAPTGLQAGNLTSTSLDLDWTENNLSTDWEISYGLTGTFTAGGGTIINTSSKPHTINIDAYKNYDFYVRSKCASNGSQNSDWSAVFTTSIGTAMSGNYTLNKNSAGSTSNFQSFTDLTNALSFVGLSGPVNVDVTSNNATYTEQVLFIDITSTSATDTIVIHGNGNTITFPTVDTNRRIVGFENSQHITLDDLKIISSASTYAFGIHLSDHSDSIRISNCEIDLSSVTSALSANSAGITSSGGVNTNYTPGFNSSGLRIVNNTIKGSSSGGPYFGINLTANSSLLDSNIIIQGNHVMDFQSRGIALTNLKDVLISQNTVERPNNNTIQYSIYMIFIREVDDVTIERNDILNNTSLSTFTNPSFGINIDNSTDSWVTNNLIHDFKGSGSVFGIYGFYLSWVRFNHNTIVLDDASATGGSTYGFRFNYTLSDNIYVRNNIVAISRGGSGNKYGINIGNTVSPITINNNSYFLNSLGAGSPYLGNYNSTAYSTLSAWNAATGFDGNSFDTDPQLKSNFEPRNQDLNDAGADVIPDIDFNGAARDNTPDIGALEFTPCFTPTGLNVYNITDTSVNLAWTENNGNTSWELYYAPIDSNLSAGSQISISTNPFALSGLSANSEYHFALKSNCGSGEFSRLSDSISFKTNSVAGAHDIPHFEGFESGFTSAASCSGTNYLSQENVSGAGAWTSFSGNAGNNRIPKTGTWFIYLGQSNTDWLFIPISVTAGNYYSISLQAKEYNNSGSENIDIAIGNTNTAIGMTTSLVSNFGLTSSYQEVQTNFVAPASGILYVGINGSTASGNNISIDDISIEEAPCLAPGNLSVSNFTNNTVDIAWNENNLAGEWNISYGLSGTAAGAGTIVNTSNNPVTLSLSPLLSYDVYVQSACASNGSQNSSWSDTLSFDFAGAPMVGNYTVDKTSPSGGTNFQTFADLTFSLKTAGIGGVVTVDVAAGTGPYTEQVIFESMAGVSSTDTVLINGNGNTIQYSPSSSDRRIVGFDGAKYITLNNLNVLGTSSAYGFGVHFMNSANYNRVQNSIIDLSAVVNTSSSASAGIVSCGTISTTQTGGDNASYLNIDNNQIIGGASGGAYFGIVLNGNGNTPNAFGNNIRNNTITNFTISGIHITDQEDLLIDGNDISRYDRISPSSGYGIRVSAGNTQNSMISNNAIHNMHDGGPSPTGTTYGIMHSYNDAAIGKENKVINNMIYDIKSSGSIFGIYNSSSDNVHYYHNTISLDDQSATTGITIGLYQINSGTGIEFKNNIISITRGGSGNKHALYITTLASTIASDYNSIYVNSAAGNNHYGYFNDLEYSSFSTWQAIGLDTNSLAVDPEFVSVSNPTPTSTSMDNLGTNLSISSDFKGNARGANPDMGAIEYTGCYAPSGFTLNNISTNSVQANWTENGIANRWEFAYDSAGFAATSQGIRDTSAGNPYVLTGLIQDFEYDVFLRAVCYDSINSAWATKQTFRTDCEGHTLPYFEDFEYGFSNNIGLRGCFESESESGSWDWRSSNLSGSLRGPYSGNYFANLRDDNSDWMFIPIQVVQGAYYSISFFAKQSSSSNASIQVSLGNAAASGNMQDTLLANTNLTSSYKQYKTHFIASASGVVYVGIKGTIPNQSGSKYISLDDISIEATACSAPYDLSLSNETSTSIQVNWSDTSGTDAFEYVLMPGGAEFVYGAANLGNNIFSGDSILLTGLSNFENYDFYLRSFCAVNDPFYAPNGNLSGWVKIPIALGRDTLNGVYTLDKTVAKSARSFRSFDDFTYVYKNLGYNGDVTLNVAIGSGPYAEQVEFKAPISSIDNYFSKSIIINGNDNEILFSPSLSDPSIVRIDSSANFTLDNFKITGLNNTCGYGIEVRNSSFPTIKNCEIDLGAITNVDPDSSAGIITIPTGYFNTTLRAENNIIKGSNIGGPAYGIKMEEMSGYLNSNTILNFQYSGIHVISSSDLDVFENDIQRPDFTLPSPFKGIVFQGENCRDIKVYRNKIHKPFEAMSLANLDFTGIEVNSYSANLAYPIDMVNNVIANISNTTGNSIGIDIKRHAYFEILHNTIRFNDVNATAGDHIAIRLDTVLINMDNNPDSIAFNILSVTASGTGEKHLIKDINSQGLIGSKNAYYLNSAGTGNHFPKSSNVNPQFLSDTSFVPSSTLLDGTALTSSLTTDFYNQSRSNPPDLGAIEFDPCYIPDGLIASDTSNNPVSISWTENGSASKWEVAYGAPGFDLDTANKFIVSSAADSLISGLQQGIDYSYRVRSVCYAGVDSEWSDSLDFRLDYCTPEPSSVDNQGIINVNFGGMSNNTGAEPNNYGDYTDSVGLSNQGAILSIDLAFLTGKTYGTKIWIDWNRNYVFEDSTELIYSGTSNNNFGATLQANYRIPLDADTGNFMMRIGAGDDDTGPISPCYNGSLACFEDYTLRIIENPYCSSPENLRANFVSDTSAILRWNEVPNASYKIQWKIAGAPAFGPAVFKSNSKAWLPIDGLTPNTRYLFWVQSNCDAGWSYVSSGRFTTLNQPCLIPTNPSASYVDHEKTRLTWDVIPGSQKYRLRYRILGGTWNVLIVTAQNGKKWINGLTSSSNYEWQIKNVCEVGPISSGTRWSESQYFTTPADPIQARLKVDPTNESKGLTFSLYPNPNTGQFYLTIEHSAKAEAYQIEIVDVIGKVIQSETKYLQEGTTNMEFDLTGFGTGIYFVRLTINSETRMKRFEIIR